MTIGVQSAELPNWPGGYMTLGYSMTYLAVWFWSGGGVHDVRVFYDVLSRLVLVGGGVHGVRVFYDVLSRLVLVGGYMALGYSMTYLAVWYWSGGGVHDVRVFYDVLSRLVLVGGVHDVRVFYDVLSRLVLVGGGGT